MGRPLVIATLTGLALLAFAGNSLLCRLALRDHGLDPWVFTAVRLVAGALVLAPFLPRGSWSPRGALALFAYALGFSLAYRGLDAGLGALLLFGAVQLTMIVAGLRAGERLRPRGWTGFALALAGMGVLLRPGGTGGLDVGDALLMCGAGVAWGTYSLLGRHGGSPHGATARNFALAAPLGLLGLVPAWTGNASLGLSQLSPAGLGLAAASGAVTSGLGYALWYAILPRHSATRAATVQLLVPALAAAGGVLLLGETAGPRLFLGGGLTLVGVGLTLVGRR